MGDLDSMKKTLREHNQEHVLAFWDRLDSGQQKGLLAQLEKIDFKNITKMKSMLEAAGSREPAVTQELRPAPAMLLEGAQKHSAIAEGAKALSEGRIGVLLVAGGQGSRLGFEGPKGSYLIGPVSNCSLFEIHSRKVLALEQKYHADVPFYIMTSELNDEPTRMFFEENGYFGLKRKNVFFFKQGMWPALTADGKIILDSPDSIFMSPDGHGGILSAMESCGVLDDMAKRGLETLFYFQVDNPLVEVADPAFIGFHRQQKADVSVKVCAKRDANEGLGVVAFKGDRQSIVEYTELTEEQKNEHLEDGELKFKWGSVAIHVFDLGFLVKEIEAGLPLHLAHKKVPHCDEQGTQVKPSTPNAYKFEKFIFDVIPDARKVVNVVFAREDEFSPVKNAEGNDSPAMTRRDLVRKYARWMEGAGVEVPRGKDGEPKCLIEIDPCFALGPDDLKAKLGKGFKIEGDVLLK